MKKYFYEKSDVLSWPSNITYGELVSYDMDKFTEWVEELRQRILKDWDENGKPPLVGRSEEEIVQSFSKLRQFNTSKIFHSPEKVMTLTSSASLPIFLKMVLPPINSSQQC